MSDPKCSRQAAASGGRILAALDSERQTVRTIGEAGAQAGRVRKGHIASRTIPSRASHEVRDRSGAAARDIILDVGPRARLFRI